MDGTLFWTVIGAAVTTMGFVWQIMKHFEQKFESKMETMDERIFWLATGKTLKDAILEEKMKTQEKDQPKANP